MLPSMRQLDSEQAQVLKLCFLCRDSNQVLHPHLDKSPYAAQSHSPSLQFHKQLQQLLCLTPGNNVITQKIITRSTPTAKVLLKNRPHLYPSGIFADLAELPYSPYPVVLPLCSHHLCLIPVPPIQGSNMVHERCTSNQ